jgi:nicotinamide-nucleotide amidase
MILAEIITIGDELLIGQVVDTNSAWLGKELSELGIQVKQITSCSDDANHIKEALTMANHRVDIIIMTGGLGPTKDDITKKTLAEYFNTGMIMHEPTKIRVEGIFSLRKMPMLESNYLQAMVPQNCEVLENEKGTAPGMWFNQNNKIYISMPGVPYEMKHIFTKEVTPRLKASFKLPFIVHHTILTAGIGESFLAEKIKSVEESLPSHIKLAYLPAVAQVRLRLSGHGSEKDAIQQEVEKYSNQIKALAKDYIYGDEDISLPEVIGQLLLEKKATVGLAESCSGGYVSHLITSVAGSSLYFKGTLVAYAYEIKENVLGVSKETIDTKGAVSEECIVQMAENARKLLNVDYAIATSGIAGPSGGTSDKPLGTVWIALASADRTLAKVYHLGDERIRVIERTGIVALEMLRKELVK